MKVGKLATRRRRIATVAVAGVVLATGAGVAYAYFTPAQKPLADPANYFSYCADRQMDVAGITEDDLKGVVAGTTIPKTDSHPFRIENFVHLDNHPAGQPVDGGSEFVLGKSGIAYAPSANDRRILTTQLVEYAPDGTPVQVRCKMRTTESLNRPESEKQRFDDGTPSTIPWGFGTGTATGTPKTCRVVQTEIAAEVWDSLDDPNTPADERDTLNLAYRWADTTSQSANVTVAPEVLPIGYNPGPPANFGTITPDTNVFVTGNQWTSGYSNGVAGYQPGDGFDSVRAKDGGLEIRSAVLNALSDDPANPIGDRVGGAYYCTFSTAEYLKAVFLGTVTPPAAVS